MRRNQRLVHHVHARQQLIAGQQHTILGKGGGERARIARQLPAGTATT